MHVRGTIAVDCVARGVVRAASAPSGPSYVAICAKSPEILFGGERHSPTVSISSHPAFGVSRVRAKSFPPLRLAV